MDRAVTVSAASGSLSALIWQLVHEFLQQPNLCPLPIPEVLPDLPGQATLELGSLTVDLPSLLLGILLGLAAGPLLDLCFIIRQAWRTFVRARI